MHQQHIYLRVFADSARCIAAKEAESQSVAVLYEHRAAPTELERTKVIDAVIAHVPRPPHTVKLKGASKTISVQVIFLLFTAASLHC
jgi:hypothetical protein